MSEQTHQLVLNIRRRLAYTSRRILWADLAFGTVISVGIWASFWFASAGLESIFHFDSNFRWVFFGVIILVLAGCLISLIIPPLLRLSGLLHGPNDTATAKRIGAAYPEVADRLTNLLDLTSARHSRAPSELLDGAVSMLGKQVQGIAFEQVENFGRARYASRIAVAPLLCIVFFLLAAPSSFIGATSRILTPGVTYVRPATFTLTVAPGNVELVKGDQLDLDIRLLGTDRPSSVSVSLNNLGEQVSETLTLQSNADGAFQFSRVNVRRPLRYQVTAGGVKSPWYTVSLIDRPLVRSLQVSLDFPAYTRIPSQRLDPNVGDVAALPGTHAKLSVGLGDTQVKEAFVRFENGTLDTLAIDGITARGQFILSKEGRYQILLRNNLRIENNAPITYQITLLEDASPSIVQLEPKPDTELNESFRERLHMRIHDDFGFKRLRVFYRLAESRFGNIDKDFRFLEIPIEDRWALDQDLFHEWLLKDQSNLSPVPGDVIEYFLKVWDNDSVGGYKSARTPLFHFRFPSLAEQYEKLDDDSGKTQKHMEDLLEKAATVKKEFEDLREELRQKPEADWQDQRHLEQLQQHQKDVEQKVDDLSTQIESLTETMEENNLVDEHTLEMYQELKKVAEEINTPEMMDALKRLQEALQNMNLNRMQKSMEDFQFNEQQYQQRLERTLELFKQIQVQQKMDELAHRAEELARREEHLAEKTDKLLDEEKKDQADHSKDSTTQNKQDVDRAEDKPSESDEQVNNKKSDPSETNQTQPKGDLTESMTPSEREALAKEQERAREEMEALEEKIKALKDQMDALKQAPKQEMQQLQDQVESQDLPEQMKQNAEQLRQDQLQPAQKGQKQMQQQLQQMQRQLQQMQAGMQGQQMQLNLSGMRRALNDVLILSEKQEDLRGAVRGLSSDSPQLRQYAQQQVNLTDGLTIVSDTLQSLSRKIPQMSREVQKNTGESLREMSAATDAMADRIARRASGHQKGAMTHLNELAVLLSDLLNQMMNAQPGGAGNMSMQQMLQQLQQMAGQQKGLNDQIQQLLNDMHGNKLSNDARERLRQMAGEQEQIRNQLKQLGRNRDLQNKMLGDLNRIAQQMQETIRELQQHGPNRQTIRRQKQILTRLLDASRSMQERGMEKKRKSKSGQEFDRASPGELSPSEKADQLRQDLLRALESGYAPDYEHLIKRYFELLQEQSRNGVGEPIMN